MSKSQVEFGGSQDRAITTSNAMRQSVDAVRNSKTTYSGGYGNFGPLKFRKDAPKSPNPNGSFTNDFKIYTGTTKLNYSTISTQKEAIDKA